MMKRVFALALALVMVLAMLPVSASARNTFRSGGTLNKDRDWKDFACKGI